MHNFKTESDGRMSDSGGYNDFPPSMKEMSVEEFSQSQFFTYNFMSCDYRQPCRGNAEMRGKFRGGSLKIFWYSDGTGICMSADYWKKTVQFYKCAMCEHDYTETNPRMHQHIYTCKKCGYTYETDSSD